MKKVVSLLSFVVFLSLLISCKPSGNRDAKLQTPSVNKTEKAQNQSDNQAKTISDLQNAFKGETTASAKYAEYSKKAEQEGYHNIALLFKAASMAEHVHANNHQAVLKEYGIETPAIKPEYTVKSTKENLEDAIKGESYEVATMYPEFLQDANNSKSQLAQISFNYAFQVEKKHKAMYEKALTALSNNKANELPKVYYVCPTCGNTYDQTPPARCGISMTSSEKFMKITSL